MPVSHRELLLREISRVFLDATGASSGGGTTWSRVLDSSYEGREFKGQNIMAILEGTETYIDVVSPDKRDRALEIDIQTLVYAPMGTDHRTYANNVLADIEEIIEANSLWAGLAYATFLTANSIDRDDTKDRTVEISLFMVVRYRTKRSNPRA
jgi:hypothetical protein